MNPPLVSIVLPVYNGADCVGEAVDSMLRQTFRDFELIAINDGSTKDDTASVLDALARTRGDDRLRIIHLERNRGLAGALNHGISLAHGRYIARQDQDDVSRPGRLEAQVRHLEAHPRCGLLGTRAEIWIGDEPTGRHHDHPLDNAALQFDLLTGNPFVHSSAMIRRSALDMVGVYTTDKARQPPEDYELWSRIARRFEVANLPERLVIYRETPLSMSRTGPNPFQRKRLLISAENLWHASDRAAPMTVCMDAAALLHDAYDDVSPGCDIRAICDVLEAAVHQIETRNPGADLRSSRDRTIRNLLHHYVVCKGPGFFLRNLRPALRPLIYSVGRRLTEVLRKSSGSSGALIP